MRSSSGFRLTIGAKLVGLIALLLISSIASLMGLSTRMFTQDNEALIQKMNSDLAGGLSDEVRQTLESVVEKMHIMGAAAMENLADPSRKDPVTGQYYADDKDYLAFFVYGYGPEGGASARFRSVSPEMAQIGDAKGVNSLAALEASPDFSLKELGRGEVQFSPIQLSDNSLALALGVPYIQRRDNRGFSYGLVALLRQDKFTQAFSKSDIATPYMVDSRGRLLAHPDASRVIAREDLSRVEIVKKLMEGKLNNDQLRYLDPRSGGIRLGAYRLVGFNGLGVVVEVPEEKALETARRVQYRAALVAAIVLCIAFLLGYLYSRTITWPIRQLVDAAVRIASGDFNVLLRPKSRDEVAQLSLAFNDMAQGLAERDRVKEVFNKFHNKEVAEKLLTGEIKLGGDRRNAVVFFSDIRGFTALSEQLEPETLVRMLNAYMTDMVNVITEYGGIVDKYVGDAIMAIWGVPAAKETDCDNAIRACLGMRLALDQLNARLQREGYQPLRIGMGLNYGPVISGNIGSEQRMEFTVIGDTVNTASRIESLTKEFGTDLLVSQEVLNHAKANFLVEKAHESRVKGKKEPLVVYKVSGYMDAAGRAVRTETAYSSYTPEHSDKVVHLDSKKTKAAESPSKVIEPPPFELVPPPLEIKKTGS